MKIVAVDLSAILSATGAARHDQEYLALFADESRRRDGRRISRGGKAVDLAKDQTLLAPQNGTS